MVIMHSVNLSAYRPIVLYCDIGSPSSTSSSSRSSSSSSSHLIFPSGHVSVTQEGGKKGDRVNGWAQRHELGLVGVSSSSGVVFSTCVSACVSTYRFIDLSIDLSIYLSLCDRTMP
jgi:hypothetical protein